MLDYELQHFEALARQITGVITIDDAPLVCHQERKQKRFAFNLDWNKPEERAIGQGLLRQKQERNMVGVIRDAVRLYFDLAAGKTDVLCELFPGIVAAIRAQVEVKPVPPAPAPVALKPVAPPPPPAADNDLPALTIKKADPGDARSASNFLDSAFGLQR